MKQFYLVSFTNLLMFVLKKSIWSWCLNSNYHLRHQSLLLRISKSQQLSSSTNIEQSFERIEDTVFKSLCDDIGIKSSVESVILSISGGVDSMAMLHIFAKIRSKFKPPLSLYVVNFNHKVRMESDEEVEFVRKWSNHYSIPFFTREFPIEFRNLSSHFQVRARKWRQEQYVDIINNDMMALMNENVRNKEFLISTAHHNDDQLETVLFNFFRGIHLTRIHGMNGRNSNGYIKPLLALRKDDLIEYMTVNGYPWREDQSNSEVSYTRNFIRHKIIPELNYLAGSKLALEKRIAHMIQQSKEMHELLSYESNDFMNNYVRYSCEMESDNNSNEINPSSHHDAYLIAMINVSKNAKFNQLPSIIRSYIIHQICYRLYQSPQQVLSKMGNDNINNDDESDDYDEMANEHDTALPYEMIVRLRDVAEQALLSDQKTKYIDINKHMFAVRSGTLMQFKRRLNAEEFLWVNTFSDQQRAQRSFAVNDNIVVTYDEDIQVKIIDQVTAEEKHIPLKQQLITQDMKERVHVNIFNIPSHSTLLIRQTRQGDKFHPPWRENAVAVTSFLRGQDIPSYLRNSVIVITMNHNEASKIIAVPPFVAKGYDIGSGSEPLRLEISRHNSL